MMCTTALGTRAGKLHWWRRSFCRRLRWFSSSLEASISSSSGEACFFGGGGNGDADSPLTVLIVGAGPVGLVMAMLLTKLGVGCAVLEKNVTFSRHPQAHFINNRSMELFRKLDGLAEDIERLQPPVNLWRKFVYCTSLSGPIIGSVDHMQTQDFEKVLSPVSVAHYSQYKLANLLLQKLENLGFNVCNLGSFEDFNLGMEVERTILMGHECISVNQTSQGVKVEASFSRDGKVIKRNFSCSIVIGADGSSSTVRKLVGINMKGERDLQKLISIHFLSIDLGEYLLQKRPGMLFFIFNPDGIGVLVSHDLNQGEFVLQIPIYPPQQNVEDFSSKVCEDIIFKMVGRNLQDINILDVKPWAMHAEVAEKYSSCSGRVILVGDAAHRFPPAGGFGMNTGIQDAHNLAWKIASLFHGVSSTSILQTYETERRPIALFNTSLSIQNFKAAISVPAALGLDPTVANSVHKTINSRFGAMLPSGLQKLALESIMAIGRAQVSEYVLNVNNPLGASRLAKVKNILEEGKSLQLQFPAEDIGFRYINGALVQDVGHSSQVAADSSQYRRVPKEYVPTAKPGSRLPHMNVKPLDAVSNQDALSTLDLISGDKLEWLLIIAPRKKSYELARAALKVADLFKLPLKVCIMWPQMMSIGRSERGSKAMLAPWTDFIDVEEVKNPSLPMTWWEICRMTSEGAILVRPDEHIAWRSRSEVVKDIYSEMQSVFSLILGRQS